MNISTVTYRHMEDENLSKSDLTSFFEPDKIFFHHMLIDNIFFQICQFMYFTKKVGKTDSGIQRFRSSSTVELQGESPCSSKIGRPQGVCDSPSSTGVFGMDLDNGNGKPHVQFQVQVTRGVYFSFCGEDHQRKNLLSGVICGSINYACGKILR